MVDLKACVTNNLAPCDSTIDLPNESIMAEAQIVVGDPKYNVNGIALTYFSCDALDGIAVDPNYSAPYFDTPSVVGGYSWKHFGFLYAQGPDGVNDLAVEANQVAICQTIQANGTVGTYGDETIEVMAPSAAEFYLVAP